MSRAQLNAAGLSPGQVRRLCKAGVWEAHGRSALVVAGTPLTHLPRTWVLALNRPSLLATGPAALALLGRSAYHRYLDPFDTPWMVGPTGPDWFGIGHPRARTVEHGPIYVAATFSALVDCIRFLPAKQAASIAMTAVQTGDADIHRLNRAANWLVGYPGVGQLREVLRQLSSGAQSAGERRVHDALRRAGLTGWFANYSIRVAGRRIVIDVAFPAQQVAVEFDGWEAHGQPEAFGPDRDRQNLLSNAGWLILRFTWADLDDPKAMSATIATALDRRSAA